MADGREPDDDTPPERPAIKRRANGRASSDAAIRIAYASTILNSIATELAELGGLLDRLPEDRGVILLRQTCDACRKTIRSFEAVIDDIENGSFG